MIGAWECSLLLLLVVANGTPVLAQVLLRDVLDWPIDGGRCLSDGREIFGGAKRWRGVVLAPLVTMVVASLTGVGWWLGLLLGMLAMVGDLGASFIKRRLGIAISGRAPGLDQLPEALLPLLLLAHPLGIGMIQVVLLALLFMVFEMVVSPLLFRLKIRSRPY